VHTSVHHSPANPPKSMAKAYPALTTAVLLVARAASGAGDGSVGVTKSEVFSGRGVLHGANTNISHNCSASASRPSGEGIWP
jgi:hypothetical protein